MSEEREKDSTWTVNDIMYEVNEQRRLIKLLPAKSNKYSDPEQKANLINRLLSARSKTHLTNDQDEIDSTTNTQNNSENYPTTQYLAENLENIDYSNNYCMNTNRKTNMSFSNRAIEMNKQHELTLINRDKLKEEYEKEYIKQTCTFQPLLSHKSNQLALLHRRRSRSRSPAKSRTITSNTTNPDLNTPKDDDVITSPEEIFTRLHAEANDKLKQLSILQAHQEKERMSVFTFQPTILPTHTRTRSRSVSPSSVKRRQIRTSITDLHYTADTNVNLTNESPPPPPPAPPIYERIADLQKDRVKRLQQLAQSVDRISSSELTFEPKINALSLHIIAQKADRAAILHPTPAPSSSSYTHTQQYQHTLPTSTTPSSLPPPPVPAVAPVPVVVAPLDVASRLINEGRLIELKRRNLKIQLDDAHKNDFRPSALSKGTVMMTATNPLLQYVILSSCISVYIGYAYILFNVLYV